MHNGTKINLDKIDKVLKENIKAENWDVGLFSELDILNAINKLKNSASSGPDNISCKIIKALKFALLKPLSHLANMSVETGVFPEIWKAGKMILLPNSNEERKRFRSVKGSPFCRNED